MMAAKDLSVALEFDYLRIQNNPAFAMKFDDETRLKEALKNIIEQHKMLLSVPDDANPSFLLRAYAVHISQRGRRVLECNDSS